MKKLNSFMIYFFLSIILLTGCRSQMVVSNGAFSDISLQRETDEYTLKRLKEVNSSGHAIFGIPAEKHSKKQGIIVRFNGISFSGIGTQRFWPILSMAVLTLATGYEINELAGYKKETIDGYEYTTDKYKLGLALSSLIAIPLSGAINNQIWSGIAYHRATSNANLKLLQDNPQIDLFLNPKYEIDNKVGIWTQKANITARVMGASIKED